MNMLFKIASSNAKYHKSKNILVGIAVFLTTVLLFLVPTIGYDALLIQSATIKEEFPRWHVAYRGVTSETAQKIAAHHFAKDSGLQSDLGIIAAKDTDINMIYMDSVGFSLQNQPLLEGRLPEKENEIVLSKGIVKALSMSARLGDTITIPYQIYRGEGLDYIQKKEFVISGFVEEAEVEEGVKYVYSAFVSEKFLESELEEEQRIYSSLVQIHTEDTDTTIEIEEKINQIAKQFEIPKQAFKMNEDYLWANYVDPEYVLIICLIMLIIMLAGIITIYSIYYVSMEERVQEFGKIKAIGATKKQLKKMVLFEGFAVGGIAIPTGLVVGTVLIAVLEIIIIYFTEMGTLIKELIMGGKLEFYHIWTYLLAAGIGVITVWLSLCRSMKVAANVSEVEAMRYQGGKAFGKRRGYPNITVGKLSKIYLMTNKKKSIVTILSMAATGLLFMIVATVLSCATPKEWADSYMIGEYKICPVVEYGNKEHPEHEWSEVQKNNPLTEELKQDILKIDGITKVDCFQSTDVMVGTEFREGIFGVPESYKEELEAGIIEGEVTYEELTSGDKIIVNSDLLRWVPDLKIGDVLQISIDHGDTIEEREVEIVAIGDYLFDFVNYDSFLMAEEGLRSYSDYNLNFFYHIFAEEKYDSKVEAQLKKLIKDSGEIEFESWQGHYLDAKSSLAFSNGVCYVFLGILGSICIMNMINTMIHSVHVRKKEFGILQAVGMSEQQLQKMLRYEGLFYTVGTLFVAVGIGSIISYPIFLWAKKNAIFGIHIYHYPVQAVAVMIGIFVLIQFILTLFLAKSLKKETLIDRIRFHE